MIINFEDSYLPLSDLFERKIFYRNAISGDLELHIDLLKKDFPDVYELFLVSPNKFMELTKKSLKELFSIGDLSLPKNFINFKIVDFDIINPISELRAEHIGELACVRGMISKATKVIVKTSEVSWECNRCANILKTNDSTYPVGCTCGNRKGFRLIDSELQNIQEIELEEPQDELEGKQPQKIRVRLFDELTDKSLSGILQPGNKISILGIVEKIELKKEKKEELFEFILIAINITPLDEKFFGENITEEDLEEINKISSNNPLEFLSDNLAPSIYGYSDIKKVLVLQMVGGVKKKKLGGAISRDRIHILLCGDPGLSKSAMVRCLHQRMPKSYYISGDETTKAGLVAIVDRDPFLQNWSLKAGALSKANDSILIIDEVDKLGDEDRNALHTPMESGEIIVNKADVHTTLSANCSILAVANPKEGMFDLSGSKTLVQQINLPPPLMSRFDIIFIMTDNINEKMDNSITHKIFTTIEKEGFSIDLFRKYIAHARKQKPKLQEKDMPELSNFYHEIRKKSILQNSKMRGMPITPRHFEGLIRLSEASAKLRLSEFVEKEDILIAKTIFYNSLIKLGLDPETGTLDMARVGYGKSLNKRQKSALILELLSELMNKFSSAYVYDKTLKEECIKKGFSSLEYEELIFQLNKEGEILKTTEGWKLNG